MNDFMREMNWKNMETGGGATLFKRRYSFKNDKDKIQKRP